MVDDTTGKGLNGWVTSHKKSIIIAAVLFGVVIIYMIAKHSSKSAAAGTGAVNTTAANQAIPAVGAPYYGGGEFGGGYATSNNFGQIQQQLASINTTLNALATGNRSTSTDNSGTPTSPNPNPTPIATPIGSRVNVPFSLNGMTLSQAEGFLSSQGGQYYISNVSGGGSSASQPWVSVPTAQTPSYLQNQPIQSFTPYSSGQVRVGI